MAFHRWLGRMDLLPLVSFIACAPFCRLKTRTGSSGKTTGSNQKVGPQFSHPRLWKDGLGGPGLTFFAGHSCWQGHGEQFSFTERFATTFLSEPAGDNAAGEGSLGKQSEARVAVASAWTAVSSRALWGARRGCTGSGATTCKMSGSVRWDVKKLKVFRQSRSFDAGSNPRSGQKIEKEESGPSAVLPLNADCC